MSLFPLFLINCNFASVLIVYNINMTFRNWYLAMLTFSSSVNIRNDSFKWNINISFPYSDHLDWLGFQLAKVFICKTNMQDFYCKYFHSTTMANLSGRLCYDTPVVWLILRRARTKVPSSRPLWTHSPLQLLILM